jgi:hypothetical protein
LTKFSFRAGRIPDVLLIGVTAFLCIGTIAAHIPSSPPESPRAHEKFDPALQSITNVDAAVGYVLGENAGRDPQGRAAAADEFVRRRFFHDYSEFTARDDWLAYLAGFAWSDLRSPVLPDDILRYPQAACSQKSIVFEAIARKLGLEVGSVRLDHHFIAAAKIHGEWRVYDADREIPGRSYPLTKLLAGDPAVIALYGQYGQSIDLAGQAARGEIRLTSVNRNPAPNASNLHRLTHFFSRYGWALFLALAFLRFGQPRRFSARFATAI